MKVYYLLVSAFCVWITPTHSQFFYSHYTPLTQVAPLFPQTFLPTIPAVSPITYTQNQANEASVTYNIPPNPTEYRGFGYRTDYKDGATSTVFYVTGPEAQNLRNFMNFPNFARKVQETMPGKARSLASDLTDVNAIPDAKGKIQSVLQPSDFQKLFDSVVPGVINFYTFPAGTVPLALARNFNATANVTTTTPSSEEAVAAESVVNPKVIINHVDNIIKESESTETTTVSETTESSTEAKNEASSTESAENEQSTEETTAETTTVV